MAELVTVTVEKGPPPPEPATLSWTEVCVSVTDRAKNVRSILKDARGVVPPGHFCAVMGPRHVRDSKQDNGRMVTRSHTQNAKLTPVLRVQWLRQEVRARRQTCASTHGDVLFVCRFAYSRDTQHAFRHAVWSARRLCSHDGTRSSERPRHAADVRCDDASTRALSGASHRIAAPGLTRCAPPRPRRVRDARRGAAWRADRSRDDSLRRPAAPAHLRKPRGGRGRRCS